MFQKYINFKNYNIQFDSIEQEINSGNSITKAKFSIFNSDNDYKGKNRSYAPLTIQIIIK